ncbi:Early growth response protein 1 [Lachnellula occidentalis]|uniref:Early growth response protein 1 n=1 Tax=Lachnellula occidentalis TaxID=215460 RepID=A0A8H8UBQ5_9HELO|nr:Early growth response protein 1 [Lachnellula occidentalis]
METASRIPVSNGYGHNHAHAHGAHGIVHHHHQEMHAVKVEVNGHGRGPVAVVHDYSPINNSNIGSKPAAPNNTNINTNSPNGTKKQPKELAKNSKSPAKAAAPTGQRFQCPRCPKNFSRIENLTRHQANHEDIGKFACNICKKRFTRSDLLNRHRRIHEGSTRQHVTQLEHTSSSPLQAQPDAQRFDPEVHNGGRSMPQETSLPVIQDHHQNGVSNGGHPNPNIISNGHSSGALLNGHPNDVYHEQHQNIFIEHPSAGYQNILPHDGLDGQAPALLQGPPNPSQGLTSLMEAALAPQEPYPFTFTPSETFDPNLWGGFMLYGDSANAYMGTYNADISWSLNSFGTDNSPHYDMEKGVGDFPGDPYHYVPYQKYEVHPIDAADAEDEETNDWPDKAGEIDATHNRRLAPRIVPLHLIPVSWQPILDEARGAGLNASTIHPFQNIDESLRDTLLSTLDGTQFGRNELSRPEIVDVIFPPTGVLDFFLRLYIRFIHPRFPVVHLPTFDIYRSPPLLLLAMMFLGSGHSRMDRGRFCRLFYDHLRIACFRMQELDEKYLRSADNILTYFLLCLAGTWSGSKPAYEFSEGNRGVLITALRRARLLDCRPAANVEVNHYQRESQSPSDVSWMAWVENEKKKRLGLSIYVYDCMFPALFNNQPYISKAETTNCVFPCPEKYWESPTGESWRMLVGAADGPPITYYLHALNACLLRKRMKPASPIASIGGELGKIILLYALHTHIFEWRQSTSMMNPTGLMGAFGASALPIGESLRDRRKWLVDGLDSWGDCYLTPETSVSATLLQKLAYISLDVSLSDMHLVAGRSNNTNDGDFAEENLKHWANSEMANTTMAHVYSMLDLCHSCVNSGIVPDSSFEVAICLFTGGIICWAYAKLKTDAPREKYLKHMRNASTALTEMGCWRMCCMFGRILKSFEAQRTL